MATRVLEATLATTLVVFLRGVNVGGHRTFRPSLLAKALKAFDVVNIGAAGTFVVRQPGSRTRFRAALRRRLPFETVAVICDGRDLLRLERDDPFAAEPVRADRTRFVTILAKARRPRFAGPVVLPPRGPWFLRVITSQSRFVCGVYKRHMKVIGYLGRLDELFGSPATTRSWSTIVKVLRVLKATKAGDVSANQA